MTLVITNGLIIVKNVIDFYNSSVIVIAQMAKHLFAVFDERNLPYRQFATIFKSEI